MNNLEFSSNNENIFEQIKENTNIDLLNLKENIEASKINTILELIEKHKDTISNWEKNSIISSILGSLNHKWMKIRVFSSNSIEIISWNKKTNWIEIKTVLNNFLKKWTIDISHIQNALMYKTSSLKDFITFQTSDTKIENIKTESYVAYLLEKHDLRLPKVTKKWKEVSNKETIDITIKSMSEQDFKRTIANINYHVKDNQWDREFLINYLKMKKLWITKDENDIATYSKEVDKNEKKVIDAVSKLSDKKLAKLKLFNSSSTTKEIARRFTSDPFSIISESFKDNEGQIWAILWFFVWIFSGKGFWWAILWVFGWALAWKYGMDFINSWWVDNIKETWKNIKNKIKNADLFNKFKGKINTIWTNLSNEEMQNSFILFQNSNDIRTKKIDDLKEAYSKYKTSWNDSSLEAFFWTVWDIDYSQNKELIKKSLAWFLSLEEKWADKKVWDLLSESNIKPDKKELEKTWENKEADESLKLLELSRYFEIKTETLVWLNDTLKEGWIDLNIAQLLSWYKNYIEKNLKWINSKYIEKLKESIRNRTLSINSLASEMKKEEKNPEDFKNNRWIINEKVNELFDFIDNEILPSLEVYKKYNNWTLKNKNADFIKPKLEELDKMLSSTVLANWDFDKTWRSWELIDANTNSWDIFSNDWVFFWEEGFLELNNINKIERTSLLNERDREIEEDASIAYLILSLYQVIPYAWAVSSVPAMTRDAFSDVDWNLEQLQLVWVIPDEYKIKKTILNRVLGWVWLWLTFVWLQWLVRSKKIADSFPILEKVWFNRVENVLMKMWEKVPGVKLATWKIREALWISTKQKISKLEQVKQEKIDNITNLKKYKEQHKVIQDEIDKINTNPSKKTFIDYETWKTTNTAFYLNKLNNQKNDLIPNIEKTINKKYDNLIETTKVIKKELNWKKVEINWEVIKLKVKEGKVSYFDKNWKAIEWQKLVDLKKAANKEALIKMNKAIEDSWTKIAWQKVWDFITKDIYEKQIKSNASAWWDKVSKMPLSALKWIKDLFVWWLKWTWNLAKWSYNLATLWKNNLKITAWLTAAELFLQEWDREEFQDGIIAWTFSEAIPTAVSTYFFWVAPTILSNYLLDTDYEYEN